MINQNTLNKYISDNFGSNFIGTVYFPRIFNVSFYHLDLDLCTIKVKLDDKVCIGDILVDLEGIFTVPVYSPVVGSVYLIDLENKFIGIKVSDRFNLHGMLDMQSFMLRENTVNLIMNSGIFCVENTSTIPLKTKLLFSNILVEEYQVFIINCVGVLLDSELAIYILLRYIKNILISFKAISKMVKYKKVYLTINKKYKKHTTQVLSDLKAVNINVLYIKNSCCSEQSLLNEYFYQYKIDKRDFLLEIFLIDILALYYISLSIYLNTKITNKFIVIKNLVDDTKSIVNTKIGSNIGSILYENKFDDKINSFFINKISGTIITDTSKCFVNAATYIIYITPKVIKKSYKCVKCKNYFEACPVSIDMNKEVSDNFKYNTKDSNVINDDYNCTLCFKCNKTYSSNIDLISALDKFKKNDCINLIFKASVNNYIPDINYNNILG